MKILIAADLYWPTINGVATATRNLVRGLADHGHEVVVIAPSQSLGPYEEWDGNYLIKRVAAIPFPFYQNTRFSPGPQREVKKIIREFQPDVIHIMMVLGIGLSARTYGLRYNIPIVATNHAMPDNLVENMRLLSPVSRPINYIFTEYGSRFHAKVDYITLPTQEAIAMFGESAARLEVPIEAISNGIDLSRFKPLSADPEIYDKFSIPEGVDIVSYIGRLDAEKHVSVLIKAYNSIQSDSNHLLIVGDGTDVERLKNLVFSLKIDHKVTFTGRVSDDEIVQLHRVGQVFCMPSPVELQCISLLEAMASGLPAVAVDVGAVKELCQNGINGIICKTDDEIAVSNALKTILDSPELRETYGKKSLLIAATHNIDYTIKRYEQIYNDVTARKKPIWPQQLL